MYQSTWFDQNIPYWTTYLARFKDKPNLTFLEIGCFEGRATKWLLKNILTDQTSKIIVVDTFEGSPEFPQFGIDNSKIKSNFLENIEPFKEKVIIIPTSSADYLGRAEPNQCDFIYVDGSHRAIDVLRDGIHAFDILKPGGSIIFDDYQWDMGKGEAERPYEAIQAFLKIWGGFYGKWKFWLDQAAFTKREIFL